MQEFIYIASHDLQEPLRKVCAFSDRVIAKYGSVIDEQGQDYLKRIQSAVVRMQTRIDDLLSYSRVTTKAQTFNKINLNQIAIEVISDLQIRIEQTNGQVIVDKLIEIEAEPTQMRQLFQNMIGNALKFHRKEVPPVVKVYASIKTDPNTDPWQTDTESCILTFEDNGIGIEEQHFQKIFVVFQRLHGKDQYEGTGVGLAICQKIVEYHNGEITVESTPEIGTKFIITLPIKQKKALEG
jgi:light-regulated signal transduction histidine kinase (bacteriophytochrome)